MTAVAPGFGSTAVDPPPRTARPVVWWAVLGAAYLAVTAFVITRWVTGPYFEHVPTGPTPVPTYMKVAIMAFQIFSIPVALLLVYRTVIRPWRRERRVAADGLIILATCTMWFQDPMSAYGGHWFTYNSWAFNRGSWVNSVPGWLSFGQPGHMLVEPFLVVCGAYVYVFGIAVAVGCALLRRLSTRWPGMGKPSMLAICFVVMFFVDIVVEGMVFMPLGVWEYAGGHWKIFGDHYFGFPIHEAIVASASFTLVTALRFFTDDRGRMLTERGVERLQLGERSRLVVRALSTVGAVNAIFFVCYNVPHTWVGLHSTEWNRDFVSRSYFTDGLCGEGTDRACPGPGVPNIRNGGAYITPDGKVVLPPGATIPKQVPFKR